MEEKTEYKGYFYSIEQDEYAQDPRDREYDEGTYTHMICFHSRYNLGDKHNMSQEELLEIINRKDVIALPLYLLDHSGLWMRTGHFMCDPAPHWDTSMVGYIYVTFDEIRENMARPNYKKSKDGINPALSAIKHITKADRDHAIKMLEGEVQLYSDYLSGNTWGYVVYEDEDGDVADSCWGYYGDEGHDEAEKEAKSIIDWKVKEDAEKKAELTEVEVGELAFT